MKITILSGGSGNDSLIKGLKDLYKDLDIKVIVNAYDNGKSTGVCRKVTNTLGVSDIRKNHIRMYKALKGEFADRRFVDFFEGRFDLGDTPVHKALDLIDECGINYLWPDKDTEPKDFIIRFFNEVDKNFNELKFNDFCVGNILYAQMYKELGYEKTNSIICKLLDIEDFVILNSFDNVYINAFLDNNYMLNDEGDIVELSDSSKKILNIFYTGDVNYNLNQKAIDAVNSCDLLVISTGTFWSSIYPTLQYCDFYKYIENSNAKKIWAINNTHDKDSFGVGLKDFVNILENNLNFNFKDFTILINKDASEDNLINFNSNIYKVEKFKMGNTNGKHNGNLYAKAILSIYYNLTSHKYNKFIFDFDDTLWARDFLTNINSYKASIDCVKFLNDNLKNSIIISGNNFDTIKQKLSMVYGIDLKNFDIPIWSTSTASKYYKTNRLEILDDFLFDFKKDDAKDSQLVLDLIEIIEDSSKLLFLGEGNNISNLRIKPLNTFERNTLYKYLNEQILPKYPKYVAYKTGKSTIDIVTKQNSKARIFKEEHMEEYCTLYIGDEIDKGNDRDIAKLCTYSINTSGVEETRMLLMLLKEL